MPKGKKALAGTVVGYARVSTAEQADSGLGLLAQRAAIEAECARRGWTLATVHEDAGISGKTLNRPGMTDALAAVEHGGAEAIVVAKLDRLSRSLADSAALMERAQRSGWKLVALDLGIDMTTPAGEMMANIMASAAQYERRLIGQRTRDALAVKKAEGATLGRPRTLPASVSDRIVAARNAGQGWSAIARELDADRVPTAQGGARWYPATVRSVYLAATKEAP
jgi:DNA invertase Pin-like site-specific DNA recombinase